MSISNPGLCLCGCGQKTRIALATNNARGWVKGHPVRFISGHNATRINDGISNQERRQRRLQAEGRCILCGQEKDTQVVLCESCRVKDRAKRRLPRRKCLLCDELVSGKSHKYCQRHRTLVCTECGTQFLLGKRTLKKSGTFCSIRCYGRAQRKMIGEKAKNWRGGKTGEAHCIRTRLDYIEWRDSVFQRDNYTCQKCGKHGGDLHAHHIKSFADYPELRTEIWNGMTLCIPCHKRVHRRKTNGAKNVVASQQIKQYRLRFLRSRHANTAS